MNKSRRKILGNLAGLSLLYPLAACGKGNLFMKKDVVLDVVLYSHLNRPIHDIYLNKIGLGVANSLGGTGIIVGVTIPFGSQTLKWSLGGPEGMPKNGEVAFSKNPLVINPEQIIPDTHYLGIDIYPDNTVAFTFSEYIPESTPQVHKILERVKKNEG